MTIYSMVSPMALADLGRVAASMPFGDFVEVGVYRGGSASVLYHIAESQGRILHLYDTFAGHTVVDPEHDNVTEHPLGRFAENADAIEDIRAAMPKAVLHIGTFPDTLLDEPPSPPVVAFVHSDVDLYWPTKAVCDIWPRRMRHGGALWFDDYAYPAGCPGVVEAVDAAFGPPKQDGDEIRLGGHRLVRIPPTESSA